MRLFSPRKTTMLFVIRDKSKVRMLETTMIFSEATVSNLFFLLPEPIILYWINTYLFWL
jgi:hypothetical protein